MTSIATLDETIGAIPKVAALLLPAVYAMWNKARVRPVITVQRHGPAVEIQTPAKQPVEKLAVRLVADGISVEDVACATKGFTGCEVQQVSPREVRVCCVRFGAHDTIAVRAPSRVLIETIDSAAVPVRGRVPAYLWALDWVVLVTALVILGAAIIGPVEERLTDLSPMQYQDNVDHALKELFLHVAWGLCLAGMLLAAETMLIPSRARRALGMRALAL